MQALCLLYIVNVMALWQNSPMQKRMLPEGRKGPKMHKVEVRYTMTPWI